jgi:LSD1 subclass zinc finger protein
VDAYITAQLAQGRTLKDLNPDVSGVRYTGSDPRLQGLQTQLSENLRQGQNLPQLHPLMEQRLQEYRDRARQLGIPSNGNILGKDQPGRHAEVLATNRLLIEMERRGVRIQTQTELDAIMKDVLIYNGFVPRNLNNYKPGDSIVRCSNCQVLTDGALSLSDLPIEFWQKHFPQYLNRINNPTILNHQQNQNKPGGENP